MKLLRLGRSLFANREHRAQLDLDGCGTDIPFRSQLSILSPPEVGIEVLCKRMMVVRFIRPIGLVVVVLMVGVVGMRVACMWGGDFMRRLGVAGSMAVRQELAEID